MQGASLALSTTALTGVTIWVTVDRAEPVIAVLLAAIVGAVAASVMVPSVDDRRTWTLLPAVVVAVALIGEPAWPATVAVLAGASAAFVWQSLSGRPVNTAAQLGGLIMFLCVTAAEAASVVPLLAPPQLRWVELGLVTGVAALWFLVESAAAAYESPTFAAAPRYALLRAIADWPIAVVALSAAFTFGVLWEGSAIWAVILSTGPYAIAHHLGLSLARGRRTSRMTVRALGRLPEAAGLSPVGHSRSVADLAVAMGKLTGMVGPELAELEVAAQLHEVGLLATTSESAPSDGFFSAEAAGWGADIMASSSALQASAEIVRASRDPFRMPGSDPDPSVDRRAHLVQVACRVVESVEAGSSIDGAVEGLYQQSLYQLDPHVISLVRPAVAISETTLDELGSAGP